MSLPTLQPIRAAGLAAAALAALGLGGCINNAGSAPPSVAAAPNAAFASAGATRTATEELGRRYEAEPGNATLAIEYAQALRSLDQKAQATAVLQQAAMRHPRTLPVLAAYGKALADSGRLREASEVLSRAHNPERPDWRILSVQGSVADGLGDFEGAQGFYAAALKIVPSEPSVLSNQGLSYALNKRLGEAEAILRLAANDPRADGRVRGNLALVLGLQGKFADAETVLKQDLPPAEVAGTLASLKRMVSQPNSWKAMRQAAEKAPDATASAGRG